MMAARREKKADELGTWVGKALPGGQLVYLRGFLALKPFEGRGALSLWDGGTFLLVQKRRGPSDYSYIAVRSSQKRVKHVSHREDR